MKPNLGTKQKEVMFNFPEGSLWLGHNFKDLKWAYLSLVNSQVYERGNETSLFKWRYAELKDTTHYIIKVCFEALGPKISKSYTWNSRLLPISTNQFQNCHYSRARLSRHDAIPSVLAPTRCRWNELMSVLRIIIHRKSSRKIKERFQ